MRLMRAFAIAASLTGSALSQFTASRYYDTTSGITYASITLPNGVSYRVALPPLNSATSDAIVQIVSPVKFAWCGLAWGGRMVNNPLSVAWPTKQTTPPVLFSSRMATGYTSAPPAYAGATYTPLTISPPKTNSTHWTATARCQGCTVWSSRDSSTNLNTRDGETRFAYACGTTAPSTPSSNTSTFTVHETPGIWNHDLRIARNASFSTWVGSGTSNDTFVRLVR